MSLLTQNSIIISIVARRLFEKPQLVWCKNQIVQVFKMSKAGWKISTATMRCDILKCIINVFACFGVKFIHYSVQCLNGKTLLSRRKAPNYICYQSLGFLPKFVYDLSYFVHILIDQYRPRGNKCTTKYYYHNVYTFIHT